MDRPLLDIWPRLRSRLPFSELAELPTPIQTLTPVLEPLGVTCQDAYVKRDDLTSPVYGGNKVRTLEVLFGNALAEGASDIVATGSYGSNHAAATVLHAPRVGLRSGAVLFGQPRSKAAVENLAVVIDRADDVVALHHWSQLPWGMHRTNRRLHRSGHRPVLMVPGGATPLGALGYVSAALELAQQVIAGDVPRPAQVVIGVGSNCTSAGLLAGFVLAARRGLGFVDAAGRPAPPRLLAVRVTPWPVTSVFRIVGLAVATSRLLARLCDDPGLRLSRAEVRPYLRVTGRYLGGGYGKPTRAGWDAIEAFAALPGLELDTTYSGKAGAAVLDLAKSGAQGPLVFWSTKSTPPLPAVDPDRLAAAPRPMRRWLARSGSVS